MNKEQLKELAMELQTICDSLNSEKNQIRNLMQLASCMATLKEQPNYTDFADEILDAIEDYTTDPDSIETIITEVECLIDILNSDSEEISIMDILRDSCEEFKEMLNDVVCSDEAKETGEQIKRALKTAKKAVKSTIRNWLLSND